VTTMTSVRAYLLVALASCASAPPAALETDRIDNEWPHAANNIAPLDPEAIWSDGDYVRYRVASNADGKLREWQLEFSLPELPPDISLTKYPGHRQYADPASKTIRMRNAFPNSMSDKATGKRSFRYARSAPMRVTCTRLDGTGEVAVDVSTQHQAHVWLSSVDAKPGLALSFLFGVLMKVDRLMEELIAVVRPPSMLSVLTNGMKIYVGLELHRPEQIEVLQVDTPLGRVPAYWLPATITANNQKALDCRFLITWVQSPLLLTVGVLRIEGHHPDDPEKRIVAHLIDAQRGDPIAAKATNNELGPKGVHTGMTEREFLTMVAQPIHDRYRLHHPTRTESADLVRAAV
jgi:hypothetical protein